MVRCYHYYMNWQLVNPSLDRRASKGGVKSAQARQDEIFQNMSADKRVAFGSDLWKLARELVGNKIHYGKYRPKTSFGARSAHTKKT